MKKNKIVTVLYLMCIFLTTIQPVNAKNRNKDKNFISLAYVALNFLQLEEKQPAEVKGVFDQYNWRGISDVALIGGVFTAGKDATLITLWNKDEWPPVYEGMDYKNDPINEQVKRDKLCSKAVIKEVVKYFKKKKINIWLCETAYSWITGGSLGVVVEDSVMTKLYAKRLCGLARELGCIGVDFDWEFPPTARQAQGYRELMSECKKQGMKVSVCAIMPTVTKEYQDKCFPGIAGFNNHEAKHMKWEEIVEKEIVDHINVMQYLGYNPTSKQMDVNVKYEKMNVWEKAYPNEFTGQRKINMLCGIGFYSFMLPEAKVGKNIKGNGALNFTALYEKYGESAYTDRVLGGEHTVWTTDDIRSIVRHAKKQGWKGVFTWLVSHDFTLKHPLKYNRQQALAEEVEAIWNGAKMR